MKFQIVCVRDLAVGVFSIPQFVPSKGLAIRSFGDEVKRKDDNNNMNKHPQDYDLFFLGEYNDEDGSFDGCIPQKIAAGIDYKG